MVKNTIYLEFCSTFCLKEQLYKIRCGIEKDLQLTKYNLHEFGLKV